MVSSGAATLTVCNTVLKLYTREVGARCWNSGMLESLCPQDLRIQASKHGSRYTVAEMSSYRQDKLLQKLLVYAGS